MISVFRIKILLLPEEKHDSGQKVKQTAKKQEAKHEYVEAFALQMCHSAKSVGHKAVSCKWQSTQDQSARLPVARFYQCVL
jgi:hypothetical protein